MPLRTWVPIWWVIFYSFGKQRKSSSCSSSSRTWVLVYHSCSVTLFVPSTLLTFGRRMNLSSILHPPPLESSQQLRCPSQCWNSYFVCNPWPYLSRVQVDVDVGSGSRCEMKSCQMYSMMSLLECTRSESEKPSLYISKTTMCKSRACNNHYGPLTWKPKVLRKMESWKKSPKWNADVFTHVICFWILLFFFSFSLFVFQLVGWATWVGILWLAWYCWLGCVCLDVVVSEFES